MRVLRLQLLDFLYGKNVIKGQMIGSAMIVPESDEEAYLGCFLGNGDVEGGGLLEC